MSRGVRWLAGVCVAGSLVTSAAGASPAPRITLFNLGTTPVGVLNGIAADLHGDLWFTEGVVCAKRCAGNRIGRITTAGAVTFYTAGIPNGSYPYGIVAGPDGNMWFTEFDSSQIGKITATGVVTQYSLTPNSGPRGIVVGPDGNLWFTETLKGLIGQITSAGVTTEYRASGLPEDIVAGPDGNLWFTEQGGTIGKITTAGVVTKYSSPEISIPWDIAIGPDGNLWFAERDRGRPGDRLFRAGAIGKISPAGVVTSYRAGVHSPSGGIVAGLDGNLWFTEANNRIAKITTAGVVTEYGLPAAWSTGVPNSIAVGPDGNLWFTGIPLAIHQPNEIGRIAFNVPVPTLTVTVAVKGKGRVTGADINCTATCTTDAVSGVELTLHAAAAPGYRFSGWSGACTGRQACTLHPTEPVTVTAVFRK